MKVGPSTSALPSKLAAVGLMLTVEPLAKALATVLSAPLVTVRVKLERAVAVTISISEPLAKVTLHVTPAPITGKPVTEVSIIVVAPELIDPLRVVIKLLA